MRRLDPAGMLDRAPVLLGPGGDLAGIGGNTVSVGTIETVEFLDQVEVGQVLAVENDVVGPTHLRNAIDRETDALIDGHEEVHQDEGNPAGVDHRRRENHQQPRTDQEAEESDLVTALLAEELTGEFLLLLRPLLAGLAVFLFEFRLQRVDTRQQLVNMLVHRQHSVSSTQSMPHIRPNSAAERPRCPQGGDFIQRVAGGLEQGLVVFADSRRRTTDLEGMI